MAAMSDSEDDLQAARAALLSRLQVHFGDDSLLRQALRHASYTKDHGEDPLTSNERLEFLGDAVVQLAVSEYLYLHAPEASEGAMSAVRAGVVQGTSLARAAQRSKLDEAMLLGGNLREGHQRASRSIFGSGFEAVIGALFLDQGWEAARDCVVRALEPQLADPEGQVPQNHKGLLNEWTQERLGRAPKYELVSVHGPAHEREFVIQVIVDGRPVGHGRGGSKKDAEQRAAESALAALNGDPPATSDR